jgi:hypothetical protein
MGQRQPRFFGSSLRVLFAVARDPTLTQEKIASRTDCTERHVRRVLDDLVAAGYISKEGRPNRRLYAVRFEAPLLEPNGPTVGDLVALFDVPH